MKHLILLAALCAALPALAQSDAGSSSLSRAETAVQGNGIVTIQNQAQPASTYQRLDATTNQASAAPAVFVNAPSADTCERAGFGAAAGAVGGNFGINIPRGQSDPCNVRADTVNLKFTGAPAEVIKARHCMSADMAEAYARAGQPCEDRRPQQTSASLSSDPLIAARQVGR